MSHTFSPKLTHMIQDRMLRRLDVPVAEPWGQLPEGFTPPEWKPDTHEDFQRDVDLERIEHLIVAYTQKYGDVPIREDWDEELILEYYELPRGVHD